jgi:hypothetical protein
VILAARNAAGYVEEAGSSRKGLWFNCVEPVMQGIRASPPHHRNAPSLLDGADGGSVIYHQTFGVHLMIAKAPLVRAAARIKSNLVF